MVGYILELYGGNGKENGNYYIMVGYILELYGGNGKENGNYYSIVRCMLDGFLKVMLVAGGLLE